MPRLQPIWNTALLLVSLLLVGCAGTQPEPITITNGQGEIAGEVTTNSVILQSRLTTASGLVDGDVEGAPGVARFELARSDNFSEPTTSPWLDATPEGDFIVKAQLDGLDAGTEYFYRLEYGPSPDQTEVGPARSFSTLPGADAATEIRFVVVTGMNYAQFHGDGPRAGTPEDKALGYPALEAILARQPAFFVGTGDNVYYDSPFSEFERTQAFLRKKWHQQLVQPRFVDLFASVPTYWEKDDHDYRYNDCDNTTDTEPDPSPALGATTFLEQLPVVEPNASDPLTYRTHRVSRDLQIWLTEGRDYRSPNMMQPGPDKTMWGAEQFAWLKDTLLDSDATFKILISPTPMIGPDDANQAGRQSEGHDRFKRDNHSNPMGFQYERDLFFDWLEAHDLLNGHFYIVSGDRHWQYHSIHPSGFEEFSTGALVDANARLGRIPGDPDSNDPNGLIEQPFSSPEPTGGFLEVTVTPGDAPTAAFRWFDERGTLTYETARVAAGD
ncbi:MAG: alkaline phosphatase D family protein [Acidobacteriota bacterium]|nr:alkaline phosphatase D family protein [Acidobacteriota bacterium]